MFAIEAQDLTKDLSDVRAVDHVSFQIPSGKIFGLLGPNGAGKTTTLRMLAGHLMPTSGIITVRGKRIPEELESVKGEVGFLSVGMKLYEAFSTRENLRYLGRLRGIPEAALDAQITKLVERFEMKGFCDRRYGRLSTGQKQRAIIANTVLHDPSVLILDEITASLDILSSAFIIEFVRQERDRQKCIVFSTHIMSEAEFLCDEIALMHQGKIIDRGSAPELIKRNAASNLTEAFLNALRSAK